VAVEEMVPIVEAVKQAVAQETAQAEKPIPVAEPEPPSPTAEEAALVEAVARALEESRIAEPPPDNQIEYQPQGIVPAAAEVVSEEPAEPVVFAAESVGSDEPVVAASPGSVEVESVSDEQPAEVIGFAPAAEEQTELEEEAEAEAVPVGVVAEKKEATTGARVLTMRGAAHDVNPYPSSEPEWRREVSRRLQNYRARRRRMSQEQAQPELPFSDQPSPPVNPEDPAYRESLRVRSNSRRAEPATPQVLELDALAHEDAAPTTEPAESAEPVTASAAPVPGELPADDAPIEIPVMPPQISFVLSDDEEHPHAPLVPVAELRERSRAVAIDLGCVAAGYTAFLAIFAMLGGHFSISKPEAAIYALAFFLMYAAYFALFTIFGGVTPGMYFRGLNVVNFDGSPAMPRALAWRCFGYLISGMTLLGFLWAVWDEDHLTWHDRISQTYLTAAESPMWADFAATAFPEHDIPGYDDDEEDESAT
jgi:uncharacterized RDD family membrane protein YckC